MPGIKNTLVTQQKAMHAAGEKLERATEKRDETILVAAEEPNNIPLSEIARLIGVRRETVFYAKLRAEARRTKKGS